MTNPLTMWNSCGIYTNLPYGYDSSFQGTLPDGSSERKISDRKGYDYDDYYYYDYYYDEDDENDLYEKIDNFTGDESEVGILDSILDIVLNRKRKKSDNRPLVVPGRNKNRGFVRPRLPPILVNKERDQVEEKSGLFDGFFDGITSAISRAVSNVGFFGILLPGILAGLLYMGVPVAQSMFAGASLITTYLLSAQNKSLISPTSLDAAARYVLINFLQILEALSDGKESRISDSFPFCINGSLVEQSIAENGCRGDFLESTLGPYEGILGNTTMCREGSLPDIVHKIARQIVTVVGDCQR